MVQKTTIAVACNKLLPYVPYFLLYCVFYQYVLEMLWHYCSRGVVGM